MKFIKKINEYYNSSEHYSHSDEYGSIEGIVHYDEEKVRNRFSKMRVDPNDYIDELFYPVAFLNNININEEHRNKGVGGAMYFDFESFCEFNGLENIVLEADLLEAQQEGFDLTKWYKKLGFETIGETSDNPIMVKYLS